MIKFTNYSDLLGNLGNYIYKVGSAEMYATVDLKDDPKGNLPL